MPRLQGKINKLYDNRKGRDGNKSKYPSYKLFIGGDQVLIYTDKEISVREGDTVALTYDVSKNNNWYVIKNPDGQFSINKVEGDMDDPLPNDDMPQSEKEWLNAPVEQPTDFNPSKYENSAPRLMKDQQIFVTAMLKSSIEGNCLNPLDSEKVDKAIIHFKEVYNRNFS